MNVVILDDERIIRRGLEKILRENFPFINISASLSDGQEAMDYFIDQKADLLITDIRMPHYDGLTILKMLRAQKIDIDVIIISGYDDFKYCKEALRYQAFEYILKPIDKAEFINIIKKFVERKGIDETEKLKVTLEAEKKIIRDIKIYLKTNYKNPIDLKVMAQQFHLNSVYISQLFKKETGESLTQYLLKIRMEKAAALLRDTDLQIQEISDNVGYHSTKQFSAAFKRYYEIIPSEYRNNVI